MYSSTWKYSTWLNVFSYFQYCEQWNWLPWIQSTLRWPRGLRCTSQDHEEDPWSKKSSQQLTLYSRALHFIPSFVSSLNTHTYKWLSRGSLFQQLCWISRVKSRCSKWGDRPLNKFRTSMNSNREQLLLCSCKFSVGTKRTKETATPEVIVSWLKHEVIVTSFNCFYVSVYWPVWLCGPAEKWIGGSECLCLQTTMTDAGPAISSEYKTHTLKWY